MSHFKFCNYWSPTKYDGLLSDVFRLCAITCEIDCDISKEIHFGSKNIGKVSILFDNLSILEPEPLFTKISIKIPNRFPQTLFLVEATLDILQFVTLRLVDTAEPRTAPNELSPKRREVVEEI